MKQITSMDYTQNEADHIHGLHTKWSRSHMDELHTKWSRSHPWITRKMKQITNGWITHKMKQITSMDYTQMKLITYGRITHKIKQITYIHRSLAEWSWSHVHGLRTGWPRRGTTGLTWMLMRCLHAHAGCRLNWLSIYNDLSSVLGGARFVGVWDYRVASRFHPPPVGWNLGLTQEFPSPRFGKRDEIV